MLSYRCSNLSITSKHFWHSYQDAGPLGKQCLSMLHQASTYWAGKVLQVAGNRGIFDILYFGRLYKQSTVSICCAHLTVYKINAYNVFFSLCVCVCLESYYLLNSASSLHLPFTPYNVQCMHIMCILCITACLGYFRTSTAVVYYTQLKTLHRYLGEQIACFLWLKGR